MPKYIGVYDNNYAPTQKEYPYRVAIKRYVNSKPEYINLGYYKTEDAAGYVYDIYALSIFKQGAVINGVHPTPEIEDEIIMLHPDLNALLIHIEDAQHIWEDHKEEIKYHKI